MFPSEGSRLHGTGLCRLAVPCRGRSIRNRYCTTRQCSTESPQLASFACQALCLVLEAEGQCSCFDTNMRASGPRLLFGMSLLLPAFQISILMFTYDARPGQLPCPAIIFKLVPGMRKWRRMSPLPPLSSGHRGMFKVTPIFKHIRLKTCCLP